MTTLALTTDVVPERKAPFLRRLKEAIGMPEQRRFFGVYLAGKMIGLLAVIAIAYFFMKFIGDKALAQDADTPAPLTGDDIVNPLNTMWVLVTAFLVFFMQAGFMMLEAGFARSRETVNVLQECIVDTCLCGLLFWAFGFAFMFGEGNGWIGHNYFFLQSDTATYGTTGVAFLAFFLFQFAFADTCSTITSGAMVGRTGFVGDLLYSVGVSGFIYPILGHWVWGPGGWLETPRNGVFLRDFAGSTVVHTVGGMIALAGAIVLGPRLGRKFKRDGGGLPPGHDLTIAAIGGVVLWFGWVRLHPGLDAVGDRLGRDRPRRHEHDARRSRGRPVGDVLRLSTTEEVGRRHHRQRLPRRPGGHHLPVLLGQCDRGDHHRHRCRGGRRPRHRLHRVAADRRPDR